MPREPENADNIVKLAEIKDEVIREVHPHEVLIAFNGDYHALMFRDWLDEQGWDKFTSWAQPRIPEYRN